MKKDTRNIFEKLFDNKICFSVCVNLNSFKSAGLGEYSRDYFIITDSIYNKITSKMGFKQSHYSDILNEKELNENEVGIFKSKSDLFVKVIHNKEGRVYELKNNSFKEFTDKLTGIYGKNINPIWAKAQKSAVAKFRYVK